MATAHSLPNSANGQPPSLDAARAVELAAEQALVASTLEAEDGVIQINPILAQLPVELDVSVTVRDFRVRSLLALRPGQVVETDWGHGDDVPLSAGDVQLAWSEFEVVDTQLAVRMTRLP